MKILIFFLLLLNCITPFSLASECEKLDWVNEEIRTQGGGRVWFKGKGKSENEDMAFRLAENNSLYFLKQECEAIPKETQFIERCLAKDENQFVAYVRATTLQKDCKTVKSNKSQNHRNLFLEKQADEHAFLQKIDDLKKVVKNYPNECQSITLEEIKNLSKLIQLALDLRSKQLAFPVSKFNHIVKEKLLILDKMTALVIPKKTSACHYRITIDACEHVAMELMDYTPPGQSQEYITSFRKNMQNVYNPILAHALKMSARLK
jgi:hypothetical protein